MSIEKLAEFITVTTYKKIPEEAISISKLCILDGFGVALAGSKESTGKIITEYVNDTGGKPESGVIGGGFKTSAPLAALANGTLGHALDYDDVAVTWTGHPTVVLLPAIFALAEKYHLSGQQILESYNIGWEVGSKLCNEIAGDLLKVGWHPTATAGLLAAAASCAKLLGLNIQQTKMALGIAASEASGLRRNFGTDTKPFHAGNAASNAVTAAILAQKGFTASEDILEGPDNFCQVLAKKECNLSNLVQALGSPFDIISSYIIKPYPSCALTHRCIDAMLYLVRKHQILPGQVAEVECHLPALCIKPLKYLKPQTSLQGKFSIEYCVAAALIDREVGLRQFTDEKVSSPQAQDIISKVKWVYLEGNEDNLLSIPNSVKVKLQNGTEYSHEVQWPKGYSYNPLKWEDVADKFRDCSQGVLPPKDMDRAISLLSGLESLTNVDELMATVSGIKH